MTIEKKKQKQKRRPESVRPVQPAGLTEASFEPSCGLGACSGQGQKISLRKEKDGILTKA